jgi:hypothetical protein
MLGRVFQVGLVEFLRARQILRQRNDRHLDLVRKPCFVQLIGRRQGEDRLAMLDAHHPARREAAAVANPLHLIENGDRGIARPEKIAVQRMYEAILDHGLVGRGQCLGDDLPAEHPLPA